jgi:hypothetical protein
MALNCSGLPLLVAAAALIAPSFAFSVHTSISTLPPSLSAAEVTTAVAELASTSPVNKVVERQTRQQQQQQPVAVEWLSTTVRDTLATTSRSHGEVQPLSTEAAWSSTAVVPAAAAAAQTTITTPFFMAMVMPGKATPVAAANIAASMADATQAVSTVPPPSTTAAATPAGTGNAATIPSEVAASKGAQTLDVVPSATDESVETPMVVPDDQREVAVVVSQHVVSNSALDMATTSIPVVLAIAGTIVSVLGAFVAWIKIRAQRQACYQTPEEPRRCALDPELLLMA